jgi:hypothetical protein
MSSTPAGLGMPRSEADEAAAEREPWLVDVGSVFVTNCSRLNWWSQAEVRSTTQR